MDFEQIYCVIKTTAYEIHHSSDKGIKKFNALPELMKKRLTISHENHYSFLNQLKEDFEKHSIPVRYVIESNIGDISPGEGDLIISCGGDGVFLSCAKRFSRCKLLGMNSDYQFEQPNLGSSGALTQVNTLNLNGIVENLKFGKWKISKWRRLCASLNGEPLEKYAVNEIFFGSRTSFLTCSTRVEIDNFKGSYLCSGILACTGMGSHAWFQNTGGTPFSNELNAFGFSVLWTDKNYEDTPVSGIFSDRHVLKIRPNRSDYVLAFDSKDDEIKTELNDEIQIRLDKEFPLQIIEFKY